MIDLLNREAVSLIKLLANVQQIILLLPLTFSLYLSACVSELADSQSDTAGKLQTVK